MRTQHHIACALNPGCGSRLAWTDNTEDVDPHHVALHGWWLGDGDLWVCGRHRTTGRCGADTSARGGAEDRSRQPPTRGGRRSVNPRYRGGWPPTAPPAGDNDDRVCVTAAAAAGDGAEGGVSWPG